MRLSRRFDVTDWTAESGSALDLPSVEECPMLPEKKRRLQGRGLAGYYNTKTHVSAETLLRTHNTYAQRLGLFHIGGFAELIELIAIIRIQLFFAFFEGADGAQGVAHACGVVLATC